MSEQQIDKELDEFLAWKPKLGLRETLRYDMQANNGNPKGKLIVFLFRMSSYIRRGNKFIYYICIPYIIWYRLYVEWSLGVEIPPLTRIGSGLTVYHGQGLVINNRTIIGENCTLRHNVTLGNKNKDDIYGCPILEDGVEVGASAVILGRIKIGRGAVIGSSAVVIKNVTAGDVIVGNPGRSIRK